MILVPRWALFYVLPVFCCYRVGICTVYCTCIPVEDCLYLDVVVVLCTPCKAARIERILCVRRVSGPGDACQCCHASGPLVRRGGQLGRANGNWIPSPPHFRAQSPGGDIYKIRGAPDCSSFFPFSLTLLCPCRCRRAPPLLSGLSARLTDRTAMSTWVSDFKKLPPDTRPLPDAP